MVGSIVVLIIMARMGTTPRDPDVFTGVCVYSSDSFSVLSDGRISVGVYASLREGLVYRVEGRFYNGSSGLRLKPVRIEPGEPTFPLSSVRGAYWVSSGRYPYLLTPDKVRLAKVLPVEKGVMVEARGIWHGDKFYPVLYHVFGPLRRPRNGMPWLVEGTVIYGGSKAILWNGSEEVVLYLPYGTKVDIGTRVRALGVARFYSKLSLIVESPDGVAVLGYGRKVPVSEASIGDVAVGNCTVVGKGRYLSLNCTKLRLYGFDARVGDRIHFEAVRRRSSLYCMRCEVIRPREKLPNGICSFANGKFGRVSGRVEWIKVYKTGFGLANVTENGCWILLKLRKSLGVSLRVNQSVTAYGFFTTYRGAPAFEVPSGDDLCSGNC